MFPGDDSMQNLTNAMNTGDTTTAFCAVNTLKGVALNLGLGSLAPDDGSAARSGFDA